MIQANELRIGNRFNRELHSQRGTSYDPDFILTEKHMGMLFGEHPELALQDLHPIPITEEVLVKCGLGIVPGYRDTYGKLDKEFPSDPDAYMGGIVICWYKNPEYFVVMCYNEMQMIGTTFYFLHQLQNIWWILTGEELQYNP